MFVPLWLIGCVPGPTASFPSPRLTASPTATAPAPATLIVLAVPDRVTSPDQPIRIVLLRPDGAEVDHFNLKTGVQVIAAAGTRIFVIYVVDQAGNGPFIQTAGTPVGQIAALA